MFLHMNKTICHLGRLGTRNLIDIFSKVCLHANTLANHPTIILTVRSYTGSQLPITNANILRMKKENISWKFCNRTWFAKGIFLAMGVVKFCPSYDSHSVFLNMCETWWHLLRLGTWNLIEVFSKLRLSNTWFLTDCFVQGSGKTTAAPSVCVIFNCFISNCTFLQ